VVVGLKLKPILAMGLSKPEHVMLKLVPVHWVAGAVVQHLVVVAPKLERTRVLGPTPNRVIPSPVAVLQVSGPGRLALLLVEGAPKLAQIRVLQVGLKPKVVILSLVHVSGTLGPLVVYLVEGAPKLERTTVGVANLKRVILKNVLVV